MSSRAPRESARKRPEKALQYGPNTLEFDENALRVSLDYRPGGELGPAEISANFESILLGGLSVAAADRVRLRLG